MIQEDKGFWKTALTVILITSAFGAFLVYMALHV